MLSVLDFASMKQRSKNLSFKKIHERKAAVDYA
jgi:hypothetical protein